MKETMMRAEGRTWAVTVVAVWYLVFGTAACVYYGSLHFRANSPTVPLTVQLLCLGAAVSAWLYFFNAKLGHKLLLALTLLTLLSIGASNAKATVFHVIALVVLLVPFLLGREKMTPSTHPRTDGD
jgi:hypothetical protein